MPQIVWLTAKHPPQNGGLAQSSGRIVNSLRDRGQTVTVLHLSASGNPSPATQGLTIIPDRESLAEPERLFWIYKDKLQGNILIGCGGNQAGYYAALWARWLNSRSLVLLRGNDFEKLICNVKQAWLTHFILQQADIVGAVSTEMAKRIKTLRTKPVIYTPNSIDLNEWGFLQSDYEKALRWRKTHCTKQKPVITMIGELKSKKGLDLALTLFTAFGFHKSAYLVTVGSFSDRLAHDANAAYLQDWIQVPFQKRNLLPSFYAVSDIIFIPSLYDGMPNVLLEAMALGKIVVASRAGAMPDVIEHGHNGFLFDTGDANDAAQVLTEVLHLPEKRLTEIGKTAMNTIQQHFTLECEARIIENAILNLNKQGSAAKKWI